MRAIQAGRAAIACAVSLVAPLLVHAEDSAKIYVYARRETAARAWMPITDGGAVVAELKQGTYFFIETAPGRITIGSEHAVPVVVEAGASTETFVRLDGNYTVDRPPVPVIGKVRPEQARNEMKFLSYIPTRKVHSRLVQDKDPGELAPPALKARENQ